METMKQKMMELWSDEEGATMVEYGLMVALIAVVALAGVILIGNELLALFTDVAGRL